MKAIILPLLSFFIFTGCALDNSRKPQNNDGNQHKNREANFFTMPRAALFMIESFAI